MIYDVAIIGGGINGCGIARDAAGRGLSVYLCDKGGIGNETSSYSTKLIHGGLRYLETYDFALVRKALKEREKLYKIAPHIIQPATFILPHQHHLRPKWMIQIGVWLYDLLASPSIFAKSKSFKLKESVFGAPLKVAGDAFSYSDCRVDDHRLTVINALDAQTRGAVIKPHNMCKHAKAMDGIWQIETEEETIQARTLINACGPWADFLADSLGINGHNRALKHVKGSHIIVPRMFDHDGCYIFQHTDNRIVFAMPYEDNFTLIGTTEVTVLSPENPSCTKAETTYLCDVMNYYFKKKISAKNVVWSYAGVRPLMDAKKDDNRTASRDYLLDIEKINGTPYVNIWGGKLTTYRTLAEKVVNSLTKEPKWTANKPLPGGETTPQEIIDYLRHYFDFLTEETILRYAHSYGSLCKEFLHSVKKQKDLGEHFGHGLYAKEVDYLMHREWATTAEDILWKKTKLGLKISNTEAKKLSKYITK